MKWLSDVRWVRVFVWSLLACVLVLVIILLGFITGKADPVAWANVSGAMPFLVDFVMRDAREHIAPVLISFIFFAVGRAYQIKVQRLQVITEAKRYGRAERETLKHRCRELTETNAALARENLRYRQAIAVHAKANQLAHEDEIEQRKIG